MVARTKRYLGLKRRGVALEALPAATASALGIAFGAVGTDNLQGKSGKKEEPVQQSFEL